MTPSNCRAWTDSEGAHRFELTITEHDQREWEGERLKMVLDAEFWVRAALVGRTDGPLTLPRSGITIREAAPFTKDEYAQVLEDLRGAEVEASAAREVITVTESVVETLLSAGLLDQLEAARERAIDAHRYVAAARKTVATWGAIPSVRDAARARDRYVP